jgi:hypothetical protein
MQGYKVKEKTAIVPPVSKLSGHPYNKKYWQEVKKMTTNLYIGDHVINLQSLVFGYKIYDQAYFDLNLLI